MDEDEVVALGAALIERVGSPMLGGRLPLRVVVVDDWRMVLCGNRICVPRSWLAESPDVVEAGITHELYHVERLQTRWDLFRHLALRGCRRFVPALWVAFFVSVFLFAGVVSVSLLVAVMVLSHVPCWLMRREEFAADRYAAGLVGAGSVVRCLGVMEGERLGRMRGGSWLERAVVAKGEPSWFEEAFVSLFSPDDHPSDRARVRRLAAPTTINAMV